MGGEMPSGFWAQRPIEEIERSSASPIVWLGRGIVWRANDERDQSMTSPNQWTRKLRSALAVLVLVGATALITNQVVSQDKKGDQAGGMTDEQKAAMAKMEEMAKPGPQHKLLDACVGNWKAEVKMWMEPGKEPEVSQAASSSKWVHGGRHIVGDFSGTMMGQPFTGSELCGYDNTTKKYYTVWVDSNSTAPMIMWGTSDAAGKVFTYTGECNDCTTGKPTKYRCVARIISNSEHTFEMFMPGPDGKEMKCMEIKYTRK